MNDVNPIKPFQFYCQPILPLVYDESLSYYETLCKVVGQLNTTGDTVNQLNEGLKQEISDRESADAALDARIKKIEETNKKLHFVAFENATPTSVMPTRTELWNWVREGDMICAVYHTDEPGRSQIYAVSCNYNAGDWGTEISSDFHFLIPLETTYDSTGKLAVKQKIVKLTIPSYTKKDLNVPWGEEIIEINTPHTSAEGMVNFTATVTGETVTASITPAEFIKLFDAASATAKLCVGVNARLNYNALELSSSVATVYDNSSAKREVRITFVQDPHTGRRDYVPSEIFDVVNIVGDKDANTWKIETFGTELFDFQRYEGFQFTRKTGNVIEAADECDPATVAQYYNDLHGKEYQNLPVHLIDEVDNADYWNGTFDSYDDGHITFTFITSNYATIGETMVVRVIELSATRTGAAWAGNEKWSYAAKEFEVPYRPTVFVVDFWPSTPPKTTVEYGLYINELACSMSWNTLYALVDTASELKVTLWADSQKSVYIAALNLDGVKGTSDSGTIRFTAGAILNDRTPSELNAVFTEILFIHDSNTDRIISRQSTCLPFPATDGSDSGKVMSVDGGVWKMQKPSTVSLEDGAVTTQKLANGAVTVDKLANGSVTGSKLTDESVATNKLVEESVTTEKINDYAVTTEKLALEAVTETVLADDSVTFNKIKAGSMVVNSATKWNPVITSQHSDRLTLNKMELRYNRGTGTVNFGLELVGLEPTDVGNIMTIDMKLDTVFGSLKPANEYYYTVVQMMITGSTFANETRTGSACLNTAGNLIIAFPENALTGVTALAAIYGSFALNVLDQT